MRRRSSTLKAHDGAVESYRAAYTLIDGDAAAGRHLRCFSGAIDLLKTRRRRLNAEAAQSFIGEGTKTLNRGWRAIERRLPRASVESRADFQEAPLAHKFTQRAAHLVIAAQIVEIRAQEHGSALTFDPIGYLAFEGPSHAAKVRHFQEIFNVKTDTYVIQ
jgi:hypothetical protein